MRAYLLSLSSALAILAAQYAVSAEEPSVAETGVTESNAIQAVTTQLSVVDLGGQDELLLLHSTSSLSDTAVIHNETGREIKITFTDGPPSFANVVAPRGHVLYECTPGERISAISVRRGGDGALLHEGEVFCGDNLNFSSRRALVVVEKTDLVSEKDPSPAGSGFLFPEADPIGQENR